MECSVVIGSFYYRLSASGVDPLATFSVIKLSQENRGKGRKVLLRHCYNAAKKGEALLHKLSISSEVLCCYKISDS